MSIHPFSNKSNKKGQADIIYSSFIFINSIFSKIHTKHLNAGVTVNRMVPNSENANHGLYNAYDPAIKLSGTYIMLNITAHNRLCFFCHSALVPYSKTIYVSPRFSTSKSKDLIIHRIRNRFIISAQQQKEACSNFQSSKQPFFNPS